MNSLQCEQTIFDEKDYDKTTPRDQIYLRDRQNPNF